MLFASFVSVLFLLFVRPLLSVYVACPVSFVHFLFALSVLLCHVCPSLSVCLVCPFCASCCLSGLLCPSCLPAYDVCHVPLVQLMLSIHLQLSVLSVHLLLFVLSVHLCCLCWLSTYAVCPVSLVRPLCLLRIFFDGALRPHKTIRMLRDGRMEVGDREIIIYTYRYTVTTRMTPALRWAAMREPF